MLHVLTKSEDCVHKDMFSCFHSHLDTYIMLLLQKMYVYMYACKIRNKQNNDCLKIAYSYIGQSIT